MLSIQIKDSYAVWRPRRMKLLIIKECKRKYEISFPMTLLNRSYCSMYIEWWAHNIVYYLTLPFTFIKFISKINLRCKDIDLEEHEVKIK